MVKSEKLKRYLRGNLIILKVDEERFDRVIDRICEKIDALEARIKDLQDELDAQIDARQECIDAINEIDTLLGEES